MAGRGPAPGANPNRKDPSQRRRRNAEPSREELPAEGYQGAFPPLPPSWRTETRVTETDDDGNTYPVVKTVAVRYLQATRDWYETWGHSPMATKFTQTDWTRLRQLAPLVDQYERKPSKELASELRLQESLLGATVMDRARMHVTIGRDAGSEPEKPKLAEVRRLRAVDPNAAAS